MKERTVGALAGHDSPASFEVSPVNLPDLLNQPFRVVSIDGATLGQFADLGDALTQLNADDHAAAISLGDYLVTSRREIAGGVA